MTKNKWIPTYQENFERPDCFLARNVDGTVQWTTEDEKMLLGLKPKGGEEGNSGGKPPEIR